MLGTINTEGMRTAHERFMAEFAQDALKAVRRKIGSSTTKYCILYYLGGSLCVATLAVLVQLQMPMAVAVAIYLFVSLVAYKGEIPETVRVSQDEATEYLTEGHHIERLLQTALNTVDSNTVIREAYLRKFETATHDITAFSVEGKFSDRDGSLSPAFSNVKVLVSFKNALDGQTYTLATNANNLLSCFTDQIPLQTVRFPNAQVDPKGFIIPIYDPPCQINLPGLEQKLCRLLEPPTSDVVDQIR